MDRIRKVREVSAKLRIARWALLPLWLGACAPDPGPPRPDDLLPPAQMVPLLADLHVAEARAQHSARAGDTIQALYMAQEKSIFWKHSIEPARFNRSYTYYAGHPAELEAIYSTLTDTLAMREVRMRAQEKKK